MKKTLTVLLALAMLLSLAACTGSPAQTEQEAPAQSAPAAEPSAQSDTEPASEPSEQPAADPAENEETVKALQRALDIQEVQNVANKHEYYHTALRHGDELADIWAQEADDVSWTNNTQKFSGHDDLYGFYVTDLASNISSSLECANAIDPSIEISEENEGTGMLWYHMLMTPVIEVAGDGQTAKGIWMSFGTVTGPMGELCSQWTCESYGMDFIKENGAWKLWHLRTYVVFYCDTEDHWYNSNENTAYGGAPSGNLPTGVGVMYDENGNQISAMGEGGLGMPEMGEMPEGGMGEMPSDMTPPDGMMPPDGMGPPEGGGGGPGYESTTPTETGTFYKGYSLYTVPVLTPQLPEPYETWEDTFSY